MIRFVCLPRQRSKGHRIMPSDQQLYDRADQIRRELQVTIRNLRHVLDDSRHQILESQARRLREFEDLCDLSVDRIRTTRLLIARIDPMSRSSPDAETAPRLACYRMSP